MNEGQPAREKEVRVLIVDDHPIMRRGLRMLCENEGFHVFEAEDECSALASVKQHRPQAVVLDLILPAGDSLSLVGKIHEFHSAIAVLIYSGSDEAQHAERAIKGGAQGYVMKGGKIHEIVDALHRVLEGEVYLSERMWKRISEKAGPGK
jgi:DNA-binding NarL/FixJ family response regulator